MRSFLALALFCGTISAAQAQLSWIPCTMPVNTLTLLTMGPNGELVTLLATNPAQPRISTDQGQTWTNLPGTGGPNGNFLSEGRLHLTVAGTMLVWGSVNGGSTYTMWRSANGGNTFSPVSGIPTNRYFFGFTSGPNGDVFLYGEGILRSVDDGLTWTSIVGASTFVTAAVANTTNLYAVQLGVVYKGGLDGTGFAAISTGGVQVTNGLAMARGMNDRILAAGGGDRIISTTDNGVTWQAVNTGITTTLNNELQHVAASLSGDTWVTGKQTNAFYTDNAGAPWVNASNGLGLAGNEPIQGIFCDSTGIFFLYAYFHLYRSNISTAIPAAVGVKEGVAYPNPTDGPVRMPAAFNGRTCQVIDAAGREVMRTPVGFDGVVDLGALESGRYLVRSAGAVVPVQVQH
jgi:hypothetical protein